MRAHHVLLDKALESLVDKKDRSQVGDRAACHFVCARLQSRSGTDFGTERLGIRSDG
jgi:hypothetical protein